MFLIAQSITRFIGLKHAGNKHHGFIRNSQVVRACLNYLAIDRCWQDSVILLIEEETPSTVSRSKYSVNQEWSHAVVSSGYAFSLS